MAGKPVSSTQNRKSSRKKASGQAKNKAATFKKASAAKLKASPQKAKRQKLKNELFDYVWPHERDVLFRPERLKYVRRLLPDEGCVFCNSKSKISFETLCVHQTKHSQVVMNKYPYNSGHILIVPKKHCGDVQDLSTEEYLDLMGLLKEAMQALNELYRPGGLNVGLNQGSVAGAGIPDHLHFHVIPRWSGDLNFFPLIAETKVMVESLEQTFERLQKHFKKG